MWFSLSAPNSGDGFEFGEPYIFFFDRDLKTSPHDWAFSHEDIRVLERPDQNTLYVETSEREVLGLGKNKRYRFEVGEELTDEDWTRYVRITR